MDFVSPIEIHFQTKKDREFYRDTKKKKQIELNKKILKSFKPLKKEIEMFTKEIDELINEIEIEEPTKEEKDKYWYYHNSRKAEEKVQTYENYKDVKQWNKHLKNALNRFINENTEKETGYAWSSFFSREIYDIPNKLSWIKTCNSFKNYKIIELPNNIEILKEEAKKYGENIRYKNEIIEDECLREYLIYKKNIKI